MFAYEKSLEPYLFQLVTDQHPSDSTTRARAVIAERHPASGIKRRHGVVVFQLCAMGQIVGSERSRSLSITHNIHTPIMCYPHAGLYCKHLAVQGIARIGIPDATFLERPQ